MILKERFKPTVLRLIAALILAGVLFTISSSIFSEFYFDLPAMTGWPFTFSEKGSYFCGNPPCYVNEFFWGMFIVDLIIFLIPSYVFSCLMIKNHQN